MKKLLAVLLILLPTPAFADAMQDAFAANARGDYAAELNIVMPLAEKGEAWAQRWLGISYAVGQGVVQDYAEAVKWYRLAAAQGDADAQFNLGVRYDNGQGVVQDYVRAHMWYNLGAVSGKAEYAAKNRDSIAAKMTPPQIAEAQKLARECQARKFKGC